MEENKESLKREKREIKYNHSYRALEAKEEKKKQKNINKAHKKENKKKIKEQKYLENGPKRIKAKEKKELHRKLNEPPKRPVLEEIGNAVTHGVGALLAIVALIFMLVKSNSGLKIAASIVYGFSMFFMMTMSCLYHSFKSGSRVKRLWRRFDYTSIYLLIGGTFAPLFLVYWGNVLGIVLFSVQWGLIITGITFVCIFGPGRVKWLNFTLYFAIGWSGIMFLPDFIQHNLPLLWMILGGGLIYTLGMIPFAMKKINSAHFIWHFFVLLGAVVQYLGILFFVY